MDTGIPNQNVGKGPNVRKQSKASSSMPKSSATSQKVASDTQRFQRSKKALDSTLLRKEMESNIYMDSMLSENDALVMVTDRLKRKCECKRYCQSCIPVRQTKEPNTSQSSTRVKRKAPLDQGKSAPKAKFKKSTSSKASIVNSEELSCDAENDRFLSSVEHIANRKHSHCTNCQCLLTAFDDESINTVARLLMDIRNGYFMKSVADVKKIQYQIWADTAELADSFTPDSEVATTVIASHAYNIPDKYGGGVICRDNWLWLYDISLYRAKQFTYKLKSAIGENDNPVAQFDLFTERPTDFTDRSYVDLPYNQMKALFEETLKTVGK